MSVLTAYAPLFQVPGAARFVAGTAVSRTGAAMFSVAVIVMVSERRDSFGLAGTMTALALVVLAASGPVLGRLVDKRGQRRVALPFLAWSAAAGLATAASSAFDAPVWVLLACYGLSAVIVEPGALSRARWAHVFRDDPDRLHTAMAFEQVADEASFVLGPIIAVLVATLWFPEAGLVLAIVLFGSGTVTFLSARRTEPPVVPRHARPAGLAIRRPGLLVVTATLVMTGVIFGANDILAVAYATEQGSTSFSSVVLGAFALGSTIAGVAFGARVVRMSLTRRLALAAAGMFVLELPVLFVSGLWSLAGVMVVAGLATAPMLVTGLSLAQRLVPAALVTEGMAVAVTGILAGVSMGSAAAGWATEAFGAERGYAVPVFAGALALTVVSVGYRHLDRAERETGADGVTPARMA
ncbi:MAG: MFS transporter [Phycicoccus sp.]